MKTKIFRIGDWVYNAHHKHNIRLTAYDFFTHGHDAAGEQYLLPLSKPAFGRDWEPIPLSQEFFEKNGFGSGDNLGLFDEYFDLTIREWSDSIWVLKYESTEMNTPPEQMSCSFVHELQHFLSHCAIDKEVRP